MQKTITVPRGKNVGNAILNSIAGTQKHVKKIITITRDVKNKTIIATVLLSWLK